MTDNLTNLTDLNPQKKSQLSVPNIGISKALDKINQNKLTKKREENQTETNLEIKTKKPKKQTKLKIEKPQKNMEISEISKISKIEENSKFGNEAQNGKIGKLANFGKTEKNEMENEIEMENDFINEKENIETNLIEIKKKPKTAKLPKSTKNKTKNKIETDEKKETLEEKKQRKIDQKTDLKAAKRLEKKEELENGFQREIVVSTAIIRPTGLLDPVILLKPLSSQVDDILEQVRIRIAKNERVLITTMTKKFAEELDLYFKEIGLKSAYIHSEVQAMERIDILADLRRGRYDVLIGINLLREGLDLPEVSLVAIMDADKEGFLRSKTSLIQIIGRAARHSEGTVIMYADKLTYSMQEAIRETENRRELQIEYNQKHGITPKSTIRHLENLSDELKENLQKNKNFGKSGANLGTFGFEKTEENPSENSENGGNLEFESFGNLDNMTVKSAFGRQQKPKNKYRGGQIFDTFDAQKSQIQKEIHAQIENKKLTFKDLKKQLKVAVANYEFEKAAAIKEILENSGN